MGMDMDKVMALERMDIPQGLAMVRAGGSLSMANTAMGEGLVQDTDMPQLQTVPVEMKICQMDEEQMVGDRAMALALMDGVTGLDMAQNTYHTHLRRDNDGVKCRKQDAFLA